MYVPEETLAIVTLCAVLCSPWFLWYTLILVVPLNVLIGFEAKVFVALSDVDLFANVTVPVVSVVNTALFKTNFKSSNCSADQVLLFADLNLD